MRTVEVGLFDQAVATAKATATKLNNYLKGSEAMETKERATVPPPTRRSTTPPPKGDKTAANTAPKKKTAPDAVDLLVDDHLAADACFKKYEKLAKDKASAKQRQSLAAEICKMLKVHTQIEEEIFYPAARAAGLDHLLMDEANIEHATCKSLIAQIEAASPDADYYDAKVKVLGDYIGHHVKEEHTEMFPKCRRSKMDLVALRDRLEERKEALGG
ncbi:MAG: hemerythrin domain-containing protein [Caldimonas sp.]